MKKAMMALTALVLLGTTLTFSTPSYSAAEPDLSEERGTISVNGEGSVSVMPDLAILSIGATTMGETTAVQQENTAIMERVIAAVKANGVAETDIETESYNLNPEYDYQNINMDGSFEIIGYTMTHMLRVTLRDVDKAGEVLSDVTEAGANLNWGVSFDISEPEKYYGEALAEAIKSAEGKARIIADTIGVAISVPFSVREENSGYSVPYRERSYDVNAVPVESAAMPAPVSAGKMKITASVALTYRY